MLLLPIYSKGIFLSKIGFQRKNHANFMHLGDVWACRISALFKHDNIPVLYPNQAYHNRLRLPPPAIPQKYLHPILRSQGVRTMNPVPLHANVWYLPEY